jgi:hypothetical protein
MKNSLKIKLLETIEKIYDESKETLIDDNILEKLKSELDFLAKYLKCSPIEALFAAVIFVESLPNRSVSFSDIQRHFDCNLIKIIKYGEHLENLENKGILLISNGQRKFNANSKTSHFKNYYFNPIYSDAILGGKEIQQPKDQKCNGIIDLFEKIGILYNDRFRDEISSIVFMSEVNKIIDSNKKLPLIKELADYNFDYFDILIFSCLVWNNIRGFAETNFGVICESILEDDKERFQYIQTIITGSNKLVSCGLIRLLSADFYNDIEVALTDFTYDLLAKHSVFLRSKTAKANNVLKPSKINKKNLYYPEKLNKEINIIKDLLSEKKLKALKLKLKEKSMPIGITILFYGAPGTGKTETAYQLARASGREIMIVDISQVKSKWFGNSEKNIRDIFKKYKTFCKDSVITPILLFNEADGIISQRKAVSSSNVAQTENAIQNIILEELENFEGIFIATTNMLLNIDSAFERRFLFKTEFGQTCEKIKTKIWKDKIPDLSTTECRKLAKCYNLSGAQIENIARKYTMHEIMNLSKPQYNELEDFCKAETWNKSNNDKKIGFKI